MYSPLFSTKKHLHGIVLFKNRNCAQKRLANGSLNQTFFELFFYNIDPNAFRRFYAYTDFYYRDSNKNKLLSICTHAKYGIKTKDKRTKDW